MTRPYPPEVIQPANVRPLSIATLPTPLPCSVFHAQQRLDALCKKWPHSAFRFEPPRDNSWLVDYAEIEPKRFSGTILGRDSEAGVGGELTVVQKY